MKYFTIRNAEGVMVKLPKKKAMKVATWGTYGPKADQPLKWVRLIDCSSEHLNNILITEKHIYQDYRDLIQIILAERA